MKIADINITDNTFLNGSIRATSSAGVSVNLLHNIRITNNSFMRSGESGMEIRLTNTTTALIANNTFNNASAGISLDKDAQNVTITDNVFANSTIGINITGGVGVFVNNATFTNVRNPFVLTNALNATINNTRTANFTFITLSGLASINFTASANFTVNQSLMLLLNMSNETAYVNSTLSPELNTSAIIRFYGVNFTSPKIMMTRNFNDSISTDYVDCPPDVCNIRGYNTPGKNVSVHVTHFSWYKIADSITSSNLTNSTDVNNTVIDTSNIDNSTIRDSTVNNSNINRSLIINDTIYNSTILQSQIANSTITNTTVDNSTINSSSINQSDIDNSRILSSNITASTISLSNITNSTINTSSVVSSNITSSLIENTTITNSTIRYSTIDSGNIQNSSIDNSTTTHTQINKSDIDNTVIDYSNITQSRINASNIDTTTITFSNVTNSTITNSIIENSTIYGSVLINVTLNGTYVLNCTILNASISGGTSYNNTILNSTTINSTITNSIINNSNIANSTINNSQLFNTTILNSSINGLTKSDIYWSDYTTRPNVTFANITPIVANKSTSVAGIWNYTSFERYAQNGSTYTWFINGTEGWRDSSLVGYWTLDGNAIDAMGNHNGTIVRNVTSAEGIAKSAMNFSNTKGYINVTDSPDLNITSQLTIMLWIRPGAATGTYEVIMTKRKFGDNVVANFEVYLNAGTRALSYYSGVTVANSGWIPPTNQWSHIAIVANNSNVSFYVDGSYRETKPTAPMVNVSGSGLFIGSFFSSIWEQYNGLMDEVKLFNRSLSAAEIANEYQMMYYGSTEKSALGTPAPDVPVSLWHFDDDPAGNRSEDYFGGYNGTNYNTTRTRGVFGTQGLYFNGSAFVFVGNRPGNFSLTDKFTVETWVNLSTDGTDRMILGKVTSAAKGWHLRKLTNNAIRFIVSTTNGDFKYTDSPAITSGLHHIVGVWDGSRVQTYVDGVNYSGQVVSGAVTDINNNENTSIGRTAGSSANFVGIIDEVSFYNRNLSSDEINQSYRRDFPLFGLNNSAYGGNSSVTFQITPTQYDGTEGQAVNSTAITTTDPGATCGQTLTTNAGLYQNLAATGNCYTLAASGITLDCNGYWIRGNGVGSLVNNSANIGNVTIKNCQFANATFGVDLFNVSNLVVWNNNWSMTSLRLEQNSSIMQNTTISFNTNLSNATFNQTINMTFENNTLSNLFVNQSGPATILALSNRYVNNTITNGKP